MAIAVFYMGAVSFAGFVCACVCVCGNLQFYGKLSVSCKYIPPRKLLPLKLKFETTSI